MTKSGDDRENGTAKKTGKSERLGGPHTSPGLTPATPPSAGRHGRASGRALSPSSP